MSERVRIIEPRTGLQLIGLAELVRYRDLFAFLVWRDIKVRYRQTVLGFAWALIPPVVSTALFTVVFGRLAAIPSDGVSYPLFSMVAMVPWNYFANTVSATTGSLVGNALLSKVYFPRLVIPATPVLVNLVDFGIASSLIAGLMLWYGMPPTPALVFLPVLILLMVLTAAGIGLWLASLAVQYRDVKYGVAFLVQALMYAAPVVWPASLISETWRPLYGLYPVAGVLEGFRSALIGTHPMPWDLIIPGAVSASVLFLSGLFYFRYKERIFADVF